MKKIAHLNQINLMKEKEVILMKVEIMHIIIVALVF